ncbi:MAG: hypothetical protein AVDCRST_MAG36-2301, partial [uncultured Nocardioidaceae bacterium]
DLSVPARPTSSRGSDRTAQDAGRGLGARALLPRRAAAAGRRRRDQAGRRRPGAVPGARCRAHDVGGVRGAPRPHRPARPRRAGARTGAARLRARVRRRRRRRGARSAGCPAGRRRGVGGVAGLVHPDRLRRLATPPPGGRRALPRSAAHGRRPGRAARRSRGHPARDRPVGAHRPV